MFNYKKNIENFNLYKNQINKNILIIGGGRWARVYIKEIYKNFKRIKKIFVYTKYSKNLKDWVKTNKFKKVLLIKNIIELKKLNIKYSIVVNKNKDHLKFAKLLLSNNSNVLLEKPLTSKLKYNKNLINFSKNKKNILLLSSQFFYANYFYYIKNKIIKKNKILKIVINWSDKKKEKRHGQVKKHDSSINYLDDIFYHLNSILYIFLGKGLIKVKDKIITLKNISEAIFNYNSCNISVRFSKKSLKRSRLIEIMFKDKKLSVNFSNDKNIILKFDNKKIKIPKSVCQTTLKYQIFTFLNSDQSNAKKIVNNIKNLKNLFISLDRLKKIY